MRIRTLAIGVFLGPAAHSAAAKDLAALSEDEVWSLQRRPRDAGCFKAPIDGKITATLAEAVKTCPTQDPVLRIQTSMHIAVLAAERVKQLTGGRRHPVMTKPDTIPDVPIAVVRK